MDNALKEMAAGAVRRLSPTSISFFRTAKIMNRHRFGKTPFWAWRKRVVDRGSLNVRLSHRQWVEAHVRATITKFYRNLA